MENVIIMQGNKYMHFQSKNIVEWALYICIYEIITMQLNVFSVIGYTVLEGKLCLILSYVCWSFK